jgi:3-methyl-2-oxobutanoate hydroxymethyltransferase
MKGRPSVYDLQLLKGRRKLMELHVDCDLEAVAAEPAGIDIFSCEFDATLAPVRAVAPSAFIQAGLAHGTVASADEGVRNGFAALQAGSDTRFQRGA